MSFLPFAKTFYIIPVVLIITVAMKFLFKQSLKEILIFLILFILAAGLYRIYEYKCYMPITCYNNKEISFSGKIADIKEYSGEKCSYRVKGKINGKDKAEIIVYTDLYDCKINDYFKFTGTVKTFENEYLFDSLDYNKSRGIFLTSQEVFTLEISNNSEFSVKRILKSYTDYVTDFIKQNLPEESGTMLSAMLFGDTSSISSDDKTLFYRTGIGHVMAVSGQHLVLFCGIFAFFLDRIKIGRKKKFVFLEIMIIAFSVCSGLSQSVLRSALMMTIVNLAPIFKRRADTLNSIGISMIILTVSNPFAIRDPSLILSAAGTFSAGVFAPYLVKNMSEETFIKRKLKNIVYMFWVSIAVLPFSVMFFGESSFVSPIMNIVLNMVCMWVLELVFIVALTVFLNPVFLVKAAGLLCEVILLTVRFTGKLKFAGMNLSDEMRYISVFAVIVCIVIFLIFKSRKSLVITVTACFTVSIFVAGVGVFLNADKLNVAVMGDKGIDVLVVSKGDNAAVIDISGRKKNYRYALKYLQESNISVIQAIIIKGNPLQSMSMYNNGFSLIGTESIILPTETFVREDMEICGCEPIFSDYDSYSLFFDDVNIEISGTRIAVKYGGFELVCDNSCNDMETDVYAEYGESLFNPPMAKAVIVPQYSNTNNIENIITDRNVHIIAENDGSFKIGGL